MSFDIVLSNLLWKLMDVVRGSRRVGKRNTFQIDTRPSPFSAKINATVYLDHETLLQWL